MNLSWRFWAFIGAIFLFLLANLLAMNDLNTIWSGSEASLLFEIQKGEEGYFLPGLVIALIYQWLGLDTFYLRLPGVLLFSSTLVGFYFLGRKVFGQKATLLAAAVMGSSVLLPNLAKIVTADIWALFFQVMGFCSLILFLKQPQLKWRIAFYGTAFFGLWIAPLSSSMFFLGTALGLYFIHPQGKRLWPLQPWIMVILTLPILHFGGLLNWKHTGFAMSYLQLSFWQYLAFHLLAFLPFLGFLLAGIREQLQKIKKKEELAIILVIWGMAAILAQSPVLSLVLSFLISKQLLSYFAPNYPHRSMVRTGAVLHLFSAFFIATFLMFTGFYEFGGTGFRAGLAFSAAYWIPTFVAVIGIYGMNRRYVLSGTIFSALMITFFFWMQLGLLLESRRHFAQDLVLEAKNVQPSIKSQLFLLQEEKRSTPNLAVYGMEVFQEVQILRSQDQLRNSFSAQTANVFIVKAGLLTDSISKPDSLVGQSWIKVLQPTSLEVVKN